MIIEIDPVETELPTPREKIVGKKHKHRRTYKRRIKMVAAPKPTSGDEFSGITKQSCPSACGPNCIITGAACAHPMKTGLQAAYANNAVIVARYSRAKKALAHLKVDAT